MTQLDMSQRLQVQGCAVCCRRLSPTPATHFDPCLPVLLLHGLGCSGDAWQPLLDRLSGHCTQTVIAPDLPGYGRSECGAETLDIDALADWADHFLTQAKLEQVHVAGQSMGCQVALALARRYPERVASVILVGPTTGRRIVPLWRYGVGLLLDGFREPVRYNCTLAQMYGQMGLRRYVATVRRMMEDDPIAQAAQVHVPCLVIRGAHDKVVSLSVAQTLAAALPQGRFLALPRVAHAAQFDAPEAFLAQALPFWRAATSVDKEKQICV